MLKSFDCQEVKFICCHLILLIKFDIIVLLGSYVKYSLQNIITQIGCSEDRTVRGSAKLLKKSLIQVVKIVKI